MTTEEEIIYTILDTVNKATVNQDNRVNERLLRNFLKKYRANLISRHSLEGLTISDECFQFLGTLTFNYSRPYIFERGGMPKIIRLKDNFGLFVEKNGETVPVISSESFDLSIKDRINSFFPKAKYINRKMHVYIGKKRISTCFADEEGNPLVNDLFDEYTQTGKITLDVYGILQNPDDAPDYDWTSDPYPLDAELIEFVCNQILQMEFNIVLQVNEDKVTDRENTPR